MRARLDAFGTKNLRRILGYRWYDLVPNKRLLEEARVDTISSIVLRLSLFGHVARFPSADPASLPTGYYILSGPFSLEKRQG